MTITTETHQPSARKPIASLIFCMMVLTLYFTTILVVSTVLPLIQGSLSATEDEVSWIVTFNILAIAIATPLTGWLVARFGSKRVMCVCAGGFAFATLMCGLADSLQSLIVWRVVQGAIGAPTVPLTQTILLNDWPKEKHQMVMGINGMGVVLGPIIGPTIAGVVAEYYGWRWAFLMLLPVAAVGVLGLLYALPRDGPTAKTYFDWTGFISLSLAVSGLQYVLSRGQILDWFASGEIMIAALVAALSFYFFLSHSLTADRPFLNLSLLRNRNLAVGFALAILFGMQNFTIMALLPTLLRQHFDFPDGLIGLLVGSRGVGGLIGFFIAMSADRIDGRLSMAIGFGLLTIASYWMMHFNLDTTAYEMALNGVVQGLSTGLIFVPLNVLAFSDLAAKHRPEAIAVFHLLRNIGSSLFISICVAEVIRSTGVNYARLIEFINPYNPGISSPWVVGSWNTNSLSGLAALSGEVTRQSAMIGYINVFGVMALASAIAIPIALLAKPVRS